MATRIITLIAFIALCVGGGSLVGLQNLPGEWYDGLTKPFFNPPNWIFGPVWTLLYLMIAIAGWRTWMRASDSGVMILWFAQLALNLTWSPVFFTYHWMLPAALIIIAMVVLTISFIIKSWADDRAASWLMVPYLAWISFATILNLSLWWLN
ncbi:MAG: TspO/MBR family protein [Pseudomonadota bacterium]